MIPSLSATTTVDKIYGANMIHRYHLTEERSENFHLDRQHLFPLKADHDVHVEKPVSAERIAAFSHQYVDPLDGPRGT
jgi:hypothetical protein